MIIHVSCGNKKSSENTFREDALNYNIITATTCMQQGKKVPVLDGSWVQSSIQV
jgi:hypothetical protein